MSVTTYPSSGFYGGVQSGQARIVFDGGWYWSGAQPESLDTVGFNTDLALSPSQITRPPGWKLTPNAVVPGYGRFSWELHTSNPGLRLQVGVTIDGLGRNPSAAHFWFPSVVAGTTPSATPATFAFHDAVIDYYQGPNTDWLRVPQGPNEGWLAIDPGPPQFASITASPEPTALALAGLGLAGLLGQRARRRRGTRAGTGQGNDGVHHRDL